MKNLDFDKYYEAPEPRDWPGIRYGDCKSNSRFTPT